MSYRDSGELSVVSRIGDMNDAASEEASTASSANASSTAFPGLRR